MNGIHYGPQFFPFSKYIGYENYTEILLAYNKDTYHDNIFFILPDQQQSSSALVLLARHISPRRCPGNCTPAVGQPSPSSSSTGYNNMIKTSKVELSNLRFNSQLQLTKYCTQLHEYVGYTNYCIVFFPISFYLLSPLLHNF